MFDVVNILQVYGYTGMFLISFLESGIFPILPGDSLLFASGLLSSSGYLDLTLSIILFSAGSFLGSLIGYEIGKRLEILREKKWFKKYSEKVFKEKYILETKEFFIKRGELTILLCKFVPMIRTFAPVIAGVVNMNYRKFIIYNFIGSVIWSLVFVSSGYFLGKEFPLASKYIEYIILFILLITTVPVIYKIYKKYRNKK